MDPSDDPRGWLELLGQLGRGGVGTVWRARDRRTGRELALKLLNTSRPTEQQRQRFLREGQIVAALRHPGIVGVHAAGELEGRPFLAFELVPGARPLDELLPGLPLPERVRLVRDAARALGHAHRQGVVHRDVKPQNLLVDAEGRVRVADFGVAFARTLERMTVSGAVVGTPEYMAPEQISSTRDRQQAATDVWALGVVLYQALTGELPFAGKSLVELASAICAGRFTPPRELAPEVSPALETVCARALQAAPAARYPDGEALAAALDAALAAPERAPARGALLPASLALASAAAAALAALAVALPGPAPDERSGPAHTAPAPPSSTSASRPEPAPVELPPLGPPPPPRVVNPVLDDMRAAALAGDAEAMTRLHEFLHRGDLGKDRVEALYWLHRAARAGHAGSMRELAVAYGPNGRETPDPVQAHEWLLRAGRAGDAQAAWWLSERFRLGTAPGGADPAAAREWLQRALERGEEEAHFAEARRLLQERRPVPAAEHLRVSAREGHMDARLELAHLILEGQVPPRPADEAEVLLRALLTQDLGPAQRRRAEDLLERVLRPRDPPELAMLHENAAQGEPTAMTELGRTFRRGSIVPQDLRRARYWFLRAAEGGEPSGMAKFGESLLDGIPGELDPDPLAAIPWLERAAQAGESTAAEVLAKIHASGRGVPRDPKAHRRWVERAAALGSAGSAADLAQLLVGEGNALEAARLVRRHADDDSTCALILAELIADGQTPAAKEDEVRRLLQAVLADASAPARITARARELQARLR